MKLQHDPDVVLAKASTVRRCIEAVRKVRQTQPPLEEWMAQDLTVLNLQRAIQACLDLSNHLIAANGWELPRSAGQSMEILAQHGVIAPSLLASVVSMTGFRNIAVHDYTVLDPAIIQAIVDKHVPDLEAFTAAILGALGDRAS